MYNKLPQNQHLSNKKSFFTHLQNYYQSKGQDPWNALPVTFHCHSASDDDEEFRKFKEYQQVAGDYWIIKPGENSNCGQGIQVAKTLSEVENIIGQASKKRAKRTYIVQKYIDKPLLVHQRKFDIRVFALLTCQSGEYKGYFYEDGYLRTSCKDFTLSNVQNRFIHLTNDAIQKKHDNYGKFENGNKMSYGDFQKLIDADYSEARINFMAHILPQIKRLVADSFASVHMKVDPDKKQSSFELFGFDFMLDDDFKVYIIEVNTNPCLATPCPLLTRIISSVVDQTFRLAVDPIFDNGQAGKKSPELQKLNYELVYDSKIDSQTEETE